MRQFPLTAALIGSILGLGLPLTSLAPRALAGSSKSASSRHAPGIIVREARRPPARWRAEVVGDFQTTTDAARSDALAKAAVELTAYLLDQFPDLHFRPSADFLAAHQMVDNPPFEQASVEQFQDAPTMYRQKVTVELRDDHLRRIFEADRRERSRERLQFAGRILGGILIGLTALLGYLRLDDWTKGYFSAILIVTAILTSLVGFAVWWWWF